MPVPIYAGQRITAALLNAIQPLSATRSSTQSVTNSTTFMNDDTLFLSLQANATYRVEMELYYSGGTQGASDLNFKFTLPSGATGTAMIIRQNASGTFVGSSENNFTNATNAATAGAGNIQALGFRGTLVTSSAGVLQLQWAQNTSNGTALIMAIGSSLVAWRLQ